MPYGWAGEIVHVDLSKGKVTKESTVTYNEAFIGGRGVGAKLLYDKLTPKMDAFDPSSLLIFSTGPLTGTTAQGSGRTTLLAKSPITNFYHWSSFGGYWGPELKFAGYDHLVIKGKADRPVYIFIDNEDVEVRQAGREWGEDTFTAQDAIREELGDPEIKVVCIGPAGEKLVRFASLVSETGYAAGRGGMGAIMGSKLLKAVAVRGTRGVSIAKPEEMLELSEKYLNAIKKSFVYQEQSEWGDIRRHFKLSPGVFAYGNWEEGEWPPMQTIDEESFKKEYSLKVTGCFGCPLTCYNAVSIPDIGAALIACQSWLFFNRVLMNTDLKLTFEATILCNKYGLDIMEMGGVIAFLNELYERGIITKEDTDGVPMERASRDAVTTLIHKVGKRQGIGDAIAEGLPRTAEKIGRGVEKYLVQAKGMYPPPFEFRNLKGSALFVALDYTRGQGIRPETGTVPEKIVEPLEYDGKASFVIDGEHRERFYDIVGLCLKYLYWIPGHGEMMAAMLSAATGRTTSESDILRVAERLRNLERAIQVLEGMDRQRDTLPKRLFDEPVKSGPHKGELIDRKRFERLKDEYYELRGWDVKTGIPTRKKLVELGLKKVADDLERSLVAHEIER